MINWPVLRSWKRKFAKSIRATYKRIEGITSYPPCMCVFHCFIIILEGAGPKPNRPEMLLECQHEKVPMYVS